MNYSNWTITGLQLRAGAAKGEIRPYGDFDFGMLNLTHNDGKVTLGTGTLDFGGGIEKYIGAMSSFLVEALLRLQSKARRIFFVDNQCGL